MSCLQSDDEGRCGYWGEDYPDDDAWFGFDENGFCEVEEDPCPYHFCYSYQPPHGEEEDYADC